MAHWHNNELLPDPPKPAPDTLLTLLKEISSKLDTLIENTTPADENEG